MELIVALRLASCLACAHRPRDRVHARNSVGVSESDGLKCWCTVLVLSVRVSVRIRVGVSVSTSVNVKWPCQCWR